MYNFKNTRFKRTHSNNLSKAKLALSFSLSRSLALSLYLHISFSIFLSLSLFLSPFHSFSFLHFLSLHFVLSLSHSRSLARSLFLSLSLSLFLSCSFFPPTPRSLISLFLKDGFPRVLRKQRTDFWGTSCTTHVSQSAICRRRSCMNG